MDVKALNKIKGDEVIKKLHSLLTKSTEKTCIKIDNRVSAMYAQL